MSDRSSRREMLVRTGALICAAALAPANLRFAQVAKTKSSLISADLRGLAADIGLSLLVAFAIALMFRSERKVLGRVFGFATLVGWIAINLGNHEHFLALGSMVSWSNAGFLLDSTFLLGSALHISQPRLLIGIALGSVLFLFLATQAKMTRLHLIGLPLSAIAILLAVVLMPTKPAVASWRQTHFILSNLHWMSSLQEDTAASNEPIPGIFPGDLAGAPAASLGHDQTNVLIVVLEGISGAYLDSFAQIHGLEGPRPRLPALDRVVQRGYSFASFFNHQRQTNRGLYSLLCGDLPKQVTAASKMTEVGLRASGAFCLPKALWQQGYETVFLQAADIGFMGKDKFMPQAGFTRFYGQEWFHDRSSAESMGEWGVDDREFFHQSLELIKELQGGDKPWFLTLLTSGTHHPFDLPESFESESPDDTFSQAVDYLNLALGELIEGLETSGVEEDTLVIFLSDESFGLEGDLDDDSMMLSQSWGVLTALLPTKERRVVFEPYMQTDVAISVLDYLGFRGSAERFGGRSLFRTYTEPRAIPFANTYMRSVGALSPEGDLFMCLEDFSDCRKYQLEHKDRVFANRRLVEHDPGEVDFLKTIASRAKTLPTGSESNQGKSWALLEKPSKMTAPGLAPDVSGVFKIFGSQYLPLTADEKVMVDLEISVLGPGPAWIVHNLTAIPRNEMPSLEELKAGPQMRAEERGLGPSLLGIAPSYRARTIPLVRTFPRVGPGETFSLQYTLDTDKDLQRMNVNLHVGAATEQPTDIFFKRANLSITKANVESTGLQVEHFSHPQAGIQARTEPEPPRPFQPRPGQSSGSHPLVSPQQPTGSGTEPPQQPSGSGIEPNQ